MSSEQRFYRSVWPEAASVLRMARILAGNAADADDLAQDVMLKAFQKIDSFQEGTNVRAWLMTILRNARIDRLRSRSAVHNLSLDDVGIELADESAPPAGNRDAVWRNPTEMLNAFSDEQIIGSLQKLPEEIRWTLLLVDVEGLNLEEAAAILDVPAGTVKSRCHRGRGMLREALRPLARELRLLRDE